MRNAWTLVALLAVVPVAAILHHAVFYRPTCMLNPFGPDYNADTVADWLQNDPSLIIALCAAAVIWAAGRGIPSARLWILGFVIAFLPLSVWIWDIPFSGRIVCRLMHDGKTPLRSVHFYLFGMAAWVPIVMMLRRLQSINRSHILPTDDSSSQSPT